MNNKDYRTFLTIWFGQLVSRLGTAVTRFALIIWAYEQTNSITAVALLGFCAFVPMILVSPFAGVWVDRLDRRKIMLLADAGAGATTLYSADIIHHRTVAILASVHYRSVVRLI